MSRARPHIPRNSTKRAERIAAWNAAYTAGLKFQPTRLSGRDARYRWLDAILASDLARTTRLVAHSLARHGNVTGTNIFPSTRRLAREASLSERTVCTHLDVLVRRGFLHRQPRHGEKTAGARGFIYLLNIPKVLKAGRASRGPVGARSHTGSVLTLVQHSAEARAASAEADDVQC